MKTEAKKSGIGGKKFVVILDVFARSMTNSGRSINDRRTLCPTCRPLLRYPLLASRLFRFKYEVNEQGDFVINDTGKKSCAHSPLPGLIIQTKGVVSRLVSPLSPYLGTRVARSGRQRDCQRL